jgi:hypothetical protein
MKTEKEYFDLKIVMLQERIARLEAQSFIGQQQHTEAKKELEATVTQLELLAKNKGE